MKWLPHSRSPMSPVDGIHLAASPQAIESLLRRLRGIVETRSGSTNGLSQSYAIGPDNHAQIVVVIHRSARVNRVLLAELMEQGPAVGVSFIWIGSRQTDLPRTCAHVIDVAVGTAVLGDVQIGNTTPNIRVELTDAATANTLARSIAPIQDESRRSTLDLDVPNSVTAPTEVNSLTSVSIFKLMRPSESTMGVKANPTPNSLN